MAKKDTTNLTRLPLGSVRPEGWLLSEISHMSELQKRLGALSGLTKNGEWSSGEYLPRYTRGLVLIAAALDDRNLKDKAASFIQLIINSMEPGGDFGPRGYRSLTPKIEAVKALLCYYELTNDERIIPFIKRYFKYQFNTYSVFDTWYDSRARLLDVAGGLEAVYRATNLEWLQDLGEYYREKSTDWFALAKKFPYKKPYSSYVSKRALKKVCRTVNDYSLTDAEKTNSKLREFNSEFVDGAWKKRPHRVAVETSGVNIAKAFKYPVVYGRFVGDDDLKNLSLKFISGVMRSHGTPMGTFSCDSRIEGTSKSRGTDVEAAVEMMESLIEIIQSTGDFECCDLLERIAFNMIPAACFDDCSAVQDMVLINQVEASEKRNRDDSDEIYCNAYLTKKLSRGSVAALSAFPIFMQAVCMQKEDELNFMTYAPCSFDLQVGGVRMTISEKTGYPFRNTVVFKVEKATGEPEVKMNFRVPKNTSMQLISGGQIVASGNRIITVRCVLRAGSTFMLKLNIPIVSEDNGDETVSLYKGNVLMSLKIPHEITPADDRRIINVNTSKKWAISPVMDRKAVNGLRIPADQEKTIVNDFTDTPFSFDNPPFEIKIRSKNVLNWDYDVDGFTSIPKKCIFSEESLERTYIPFGCSLLHISAFPKCLK